MMDPEIYLRDDPELLRAVKKRLWSHLAERTEKEYLPSGCVLYHFPVRSTVSTCDFWDQIIVPAVPKWLGDGRRKE